jgi:hypothetical protein
MGGPCGAVAPTISTSFGAADRAICTIMSVVALLVFGLIRRMRVPAALTEPRAATRPAVAAAPVTASRCLREMSLRMLHPLFRPSGE